MFIVVSLSFSYDSLDKSCSRDFNFDFKCEFSLFKAFNWSFNIKNIKTKITIFSLETSNDTIMNEIRQIDLETPGVIITKFFFQLTGIFGDTQIQHRFNDYLYSL